MSHKTPKKSDHDPDNPMPAVSFREWRKRLGLKQKEAADLLGLKKRMIQYYETGNRSGKEVVIPKSIRLACYALESGVGDYDGSRVLMGTGSLLGHTNNKTPLPGQIDPQTIARSGLGWRKSDGA